MYFIVNIWQIFNGFLEIKQSVMHINIFFFLYKY